MDAKEFKQGLMMHTEELQAARQAADKWTSPSGATSSGKVSDYRLIPPIALAALASRFELGLEKHGLNNWRKGVGDEKWEIDRFNHIIEHLLRYADQLWGSKTIPHDGETPIENLAAAMWGCVILIECEHRRVNE